MNKNLFLTYWSSPDVVRNKEVLDTININIKSGLFTNIHIFTEEDSKQDLKFNEINVKVIVGSRKTYQDIFNYSNELYSSNNNINILANSDIEFDSSINLTENMSKEDFLALTRHNRVTNDLEYSFLTEYSDSQDVWIWRGHNSLLECNFYLGVPGCDNKIAFHVFTQGYHIRNPSKSIKIYHNHLTESRPGSSKSLNMRVERPYVYLKPTFWGEKYEALAEVQHTKNEHRRIKEGEIN